LIAATDLTLESNKKGKDELGRVTELIIRYATERAKNVQSPVGSVEKS
jgi:hypothetical protein